MAQRDTQQFRDRWHPGRVRNSNRRSQRGDEPQAQAEGGSRRRLQQGPQHDLGRSRERNIGGYTGNDLRGDGEPSSDTLQGQPSVAARGERQDFLRPQRQERSLNTVAGYGNRSGAYGNRGEDDDRAGEDFRGRGPKGYTRSDERIREDICERLLDDAVIDASDITVTCQDGIVTLEGSVDRRAIKHRIEDLADACRGVRDIHNRIQVGSGIGQAIGNALASMKEAVTPSKGRKTKSRN